MTAPNGFARRTDSWSSHVAGAAIYRDGTLSALILEAAKVFDRYNVSDVRPHPIFTDTDLTEWIEIHTGKRQQRNVIARARQLMMDTERHPNPDSPFEEVGLFDYDGRPMLHFRLKVSTTPIQEGLF